MKTLFTILITISILAGAAQAFAATATLTDDTTIISEGSGDLSNPKQSFQGILDPANPAVLHSMQAWALRYKTELYEGPDADRLPNTLYVAASNAMVLLTDSTYNWQLNSASHEKYVWLAEQNTTRGGQFAMLVGGDTQANQIRFDEAFTYNGVQGYSRLAGRTSSAYMTDLIGDCGSGINIPCITNVRVDQPYSGYMTVSLTWNQPSGASILYTRDGIEDRASYAKYGFDHSSQTDALADMIRGWQIFYINSNESFTVGNRAGFVEVSDFETDAVPAGPVKRSTNTTATISIPMVDGALPAFAVAPVFDGPATEHTLGEGSVELSRVISNIATVPVFAAFRVTKDRMIMTLSWQSANENLLSEFRIYRSTDLALDWIQIGEAVPALGSGYQYTVKDSIANMTRKPKIIRYKVEALDHDGVVGRVEKAFTSK